MNTQARKEIVDAMAENILDNMTIRKDVKKINFSVFQIFGQCHLMPDIILTNEETNYINDKLNKHKDKWKRINE